MLQRLQHLYGYDVLNCHTPAPEDLNVNLNFPRHKRLSITPSLACHPFMCICVD